MDNKLKITLEKDGRKVVVETSQYINLDTCVTDLVGLLTAYGFNPVTIKPNLIELCEGKSFPINKVTADGTKGMIRGE